VEKIWLKHYDAGVPAEIHVDPNDSLKAHIERAFNAFPDLPAFTNLGKTLTYHEIDEKSRAFAAYLQHLGYKKGDRFAIMMPNTLQYVIGMIGVLRAGCVVVNVNPLYTAYELGHQLKDSGARGILILANFANVLEETCQHVNIEHMIVTQVGDELSLVKRLLVNFVLKYIKKMVPHYSVKNVVDYNSMMKTAMTLDYQPVTLTGEDIAYLQYTGGTTGLAKGAVLTHRNILSNIAQVQAWAFPFFSKDRKELIVTALPMYHIFSLTVNLWSFIQDGGHNYLITNPRDIPGFIKEIKHLKFTTTTGVNTLFNALVSDPHFKEVDFSELKFIIAGGMALQAPAAEAFKRITGHSIAQGYGLTETSPVASAMPIGTNIFKGSIGIPFPSTEMAIMDEQGNFLPIGEEGELCVRGPQVMRGYWNQPQATAETITSEGWLKTGDVAKMDDEGYFYIVDRKKNMIVVSGFNVYPNEVEAVIAEIPAVKEVAVIGVPDERTSERVKAFIVKSDESLTEKVVMDYCYKKLTRYKVPKSIEFRDELPKSNVGKILHRLLRDNAEKNIKASDAK
jgi:long-chain acyl-CoA synthetase